MGRVLCGHRLRVSRFLEDCQWPSLSGELNPKVLLPSAAGSGVVTGPEAGVGAEDRLEALKQFEPEGELATVFDGGNGEEPEVQPGTEVETGGLVGAVGGPWAETAAVCGPAVTVGEDGAGAVGKLLHSY